MPLINSWVVPWARGYASAMGNLTDRKVQSRLMFAAGWNNPDWFGCRLDSQNFSGAVTAELSVPVASAAVLGMAAAVSPHGSDVGNRDDEPIGPGAFNDRAAARTVALQRGTGRDMR